MWAHDHWGLEQPPDIVTFAKKAQIAGFFSGPSMRPKEGYRIFNTWMGDPAKVLLLSLSPSLSLSIYLSICLSLFLFLSSVSLSALLN